jgi:hypothetical protein
MEKTLLKSLISHLSREGFKMFVEELFGHYNQKGEPFYALPHIGEGVYCRELLDSYGGSIHTVYLLHFSPIELFKNPKKMLVADPSMTSKLTKIQRLYSGQFGYWGMVDPYLRKSNKLNTLYFLSNSPTLTEEVCKKLYYPVYKKIINKLKIDTISYGMGTCDSFVSNSPADSEESLTKLLLKTGEGLSISLGPEEQRVDRFIGEKSLAGGISQVYKIPYQPIFLLKEKQEAIYEFENRK